MFVRNDMTVDARILKEAASLRDAGHAVTIMAITRPDAPREIERDPRDGFDIVRVPLPRWRHWWRWFRLPSRLWSMLKSRSIHAREGERMDGLDWLAMWRFGTLGWARAAATEAGVADVYHGHDLTGLPAAVFARRLHNPGAKLVYDSHELYVDSAATVGRPPWAVNWLIRREREWSSEVDALVTVSDGLADLLRKRLGIETITVVHNCPPRPTGPLERTNLVREALGLPDDARVVIYTGGLRAGRGVEELARAMLEPGLEAVHLAFLGFGPLRRGRRGDRGRPALRRPGPPAEAGVAARGRELGVVDGRRRDGDPGDEPELRALDAEQDVRGVRRGRAGRRQRLPGLPDDRRSTIRRVRSASCSTRRRRPSIGAAIRRILELPRAEYDAMASRARSAAIERWNWETESAKLVALYGRLAGA